MKNGYSLSRAWFDWAFENPDKVNVNHTALYMWYIEKWNRVGQKDKFSITTSESMEAVGFKSRNTFSITFKDLIDFGFIILVKKSHNQNTCNIITLAQKLNKQKDSTRTALDKALIQQDSKQDDSFDTINKQINNETSKQVNVFIPPTVEMVIQYFKENGFTEQSAKTAFNFYNVADWHDSNNKKIKRWKQKMVGVWFKDENKITGLVTGDYTPKMVR